MRYLLAALLLTVTPAAFAACPDPLPEDTICLEWEAPTQNVDGTPLTDLAGFQIKYGFASRDYEADLVDVPDPSRTDQVVSTNGEIVIPSPGAEGGDVEVFFAMTAYDDDGNISADSNEVTRTVTFPDTGAPQPPRIITLLLNVRTD